MGGRGSTNRLVVDERSVARKDETYSTVGPIKKGDRRDVGLLRVYMGVGY